MYMFSHAFYNENMINIHNAYESACAHTSICIAFHKFMCTSAMKK